MRLHLFVFVFAVVFCTGCSNNPSKPDERGASGGHATPAAATDQSTTPKNPDTPASRELGTRATGSGGTRYSGPGPEMTDAKGTTKAGSGPPRTR